jgi:hypothetical protein
MDRLADNSTNASDSYISNCNIIATDGTRIVVPYTKMTENTIMFDDGTRYCYVYKLNKDGTCGDLIRLVEY